VYQVRCHLLTPIEVQAQRFGTAHAVYGEFMFRLRWAIDSARCNEITTGIGFD
jgi:hypothetical protein